MKKQKTIALFLAIALTFALFTGCGGGNASKDTSENNNSGSTSSSTSAATVSPSGTPSPYKLAAGKYKTNSEGFPTEKYNYELPLTTTDESFTQWTTCYTPQYIPADGWGSIDVWAGLRKKTGVNIEYDIVSSDTRKQNFSVLLASDDLRDIMDQGLYFYTDTPLSAISNGYFVNLYDYKDYMPNYMYETYTRAQHSKDVMDKVFYDKKTITGFLGMVVEPTPSMGMMIRQDWLDKAGLGKAIDITTYDELTNAMTAFKTADASRYPLWVTSTIMAGNYNYLYCGFNTILWSQDLTYKRVVNDKVQFCGTTDDDKEAMTQLNSWFSKGFVDPNYSAHTATYDSTAEFSGGQVGVTGNTPSQVVKLETTNKDPNCRWEAMKMPRKTDGQVLKFGLALNDFNYGSTNIAAKCTNIPLIVSWVDYWYSPEGSDYTSWGVEGTTYTVDQNGKRLLTDFITKSEEGTSYALCIYATCGLLNAGLFVHKRGYAIPGGDRFLAMFDIWSEKPETYSGEYDWPAGVKLTAEQSKDAVAISGDLNTFFSENYISFMDGSKPMTEWDSFQQGLKGVGLDKLTKIYQDAYDTYKASKKA